MAGTILANTLLNAGKSIKVIDNNHNSAATKAAAGLINPITGRYFAKSWNIENLLPIAEDCYRDLEKQLQAQYYTSVNIYRALFTIEDANNWSLRVQDERYEQFASNGEEKCNLYKLTNPTESLALIQRGARVAISKLIQDYKQFLTQKNQLLSETFDFSKLQISTDQVIYKSVQAKGIIFSEGYRLTENPYFKYLPIAPAKGESLILRTKCKWDKSKVLKHQQYLVPISENQLWSGGGFKWKFEDEAPTQDYFDKQSEALRNFVKFDYEIANHLAGVRPCMKDRKPVIGQHPKYNTLFVFNGMGTKGTSLAPWCAKQFVDFLLYNKTISPEVNCERFAKYFD